jgi:L-alanine-DL-glutamate epimerase-like enolase superfamily enzyme
MASNSSRIRPSRPSVTWRICIWRRARASQLHATKLCELNDPSPRQHAVFENPPKPVDGLFHLPTEPGLGLRINEGELARRRIPIA